MSTDKTHNQHCTSDQISTKVIKSQKQTIFVKNYITTILKFISAKCKQNKHCMLLALKAKKMQSDNTLVNI